MLYAAMVKTTKKLSDTCQIQVSDNFFYAPAGTRTPDTRLKRAVLYLLSYWGKLKEAGTAGLEPTMTESKSGVLPLTPRPKI